MLDFQNFKFLVAIRFGRASMHHCTKFHQNRSNGFGDITFKFAVTDIMCFAMKYLEAAMCERVWHHVAIRFIKLVVPLTHF